MRSPIFRSDQNKIFTGLHSVTNKNKKIYINTCIPITLRDTCSQKGNRTHRTFDLWHKEIMDILDEAGGYNHQKVPFIFNTSFFGEAFKSKIYHVRDTICQIWLSF